eukprot:8239808-Alexandrium_andersonii.AAC.1
MGCRALHPLGHPERGDPASGGGCLPCQGGPAQTMDHRGHLQVGPAAPWRPAGAPASQDSRVRLVCPGRPSGVGSGCPAP